MEAAHYVLAGGGTGGHLFPGLAVADEIRRQRPDARITFLTTQRPLDRQLLERTDYLQVPQPVRPLTVHPLRVPGFLWAWRGSVRQARAYLRAHHVQAVLGLGGYGAGPAVVAAHALGIRAAILNPDAVPGRANRFLARKADLVVMQWEASRGRFPAAANCRALGCPIRRQFAAADAEAGRRRFELEPGRPVLLVTGASQGARSVNETLMQVWPQFRARHAEWQLLHLTGVADEPAVRDAYARAGVPAQVVAFTHEMADALAAADVVVARAGASTLAELTALGKPAILLPYPYHRDQHQRANAQVLVDAGAAVLVEDRRSGAVNAPDVLAALERLADSARRVEMAAAAARIGRPRAAADVAGWLVQAERVEGGQGAGVVLPDGARRA